MAKQTFTTGQVLTAAQMTSLQQTAMGGGSATTKTASYTLVAADAGTTVTMTSASATTITVNTSLFAAGDTVYIQNLGAGVSTITAGTATVNTSASLALAQYEGGQLYFVSTSASIFLKGDGAAAGASFSGCNVFNNTSQSVANATTTTAVFNDERYDTDAYHDNSTNNSRITIPAGKTGKYLVFFTIVVSQSASATNTYFETQLKKNGTTALYTLYSPQYRFNASFFGNANIGSVVLSLTAGDYLEVLCYQNQGASVDINANTLSQFGATYLGA